MNRLHRHANPNSIYSRDCRWCRVEDWINRIDCQVEKFLVALRRLITGKEE